ncbi:hypothetical protein BK120_21805 [Paenibacillus sp. FSL A5-0031]|uniref:hypothetical protein n=1 Tax=Paenibacillus sp. FSL A5-0031 TaxID=1920420 RepID=UPI00096E0B2A|nr:hypothetical protein [Paenibacillus sp. FSL A5-0031]OME79614.1 hypothetical protein BK120_21805 [Paenibacillus sp. FSL A5-0031]
MKWVLTVILLTPILILFSAWNQDEYLQTKLKAELKEGMDLATHDASLQIIQEELEKGSIRFDPLEAEKVLRRSMQTTFKLNGLLEPLPNGIWLDPFELVWFDRIESGTFPQVYQSGPPYYYSDIIKGPSIIAIVKVKHPRYFGVSDDFEYVVGSSHEYVK